MKIDGPLLLSNTTSLRDGTDDVVRDRFRVTWDLAEGGSSSNELIKAMLPCRCTCDSVH